MIIAITSAGTLELNEPNDFKGFKIAVEKIGMTDAQIEVALDGVATMDAAHDHAWVRQDALRNWKGKPQPTEWIESFDKMIEKVKPYGWIDEANGAVRGHIERAG